MSNSKQCEKKEELIAEKLGLKKIIGTKRSAFFMGQIKLDEKEQEYLRTVSVPRHHKIMMYGKEVQPRRDTQFFADEAKSYAYSGSKATAETPPDVLQKLLEKINEMFDDNFNGVLVNVYRDGNDYIGAHSDDESNLGRSGVVMIVWGEERIFRIRDKRTNKRLHDVVIPSGTLAWMSGKFQKEFKHEIPIQKRKKGRRVSLTFRLHRS